MTDLPPAYSFTAYIDESGELGMDFDRKSSEFLVMAAAIVPNYLPHIDDDFFHHVRQLYNVQRDGVPKFQRCNDKLKFVICRMMPFYGIRTVHVVFHKPSLIGTHIGLNQNAMYSYLLKFTLERVSWEIRDRQNARDPGNGKCCVKFSENAALPYDRMKTYLNRLRLEPNRHNHSILWDVLSIDDAEPEPHQNETKFHFADIAASATFTAFDISNRSHGMTDDRFLRLLEPGICCDRKGLFGFKFFPSGASLGDRDLFEIVGLLR